MINTIPYKGGLYPDFQATGNAARFVIPFAKEVCKGIGFDIGANREEWKLPGSIAIDPAIDDRFDAFNLPPQVVDFIFSSHCLEHLPDWVKALDHWTERLTKDGVLFLYLPDYSQFYWRPWNNRKHINILSPQMISDYLKDRGYINVFSSGVDLNNSFIVMAQKCTD